jgi:hypothetical protein
MTTEVLDIDHTREKLRQILDRPKLKARGGSKEAKRLYLSRLCERHWIVPVYRATNRQIHY